MDKTLIELVIDKVKDWQKAEAAWIVPMATIFVERRAHLPSTGTLGLASRGMWPVSRGSSWTSTMRA